MDWRYANFQHTPPPMPRSFILIDETRYAVFLYNLLFYCPMCRDTEPLLNSRERNQRVFDIKHYSWLAEGS